MRKGLKIGIRCAAVLFAAVFVSLFLTGCPAGGGGGGGTPTNPGTTDPIHTTFTASKPYIYETGKSYTASVTVQETRGDDITINKVRTYRTLTMSGNYDSEPSQNYYYAGASMIYGYMLIPNSSAVVENISSTGTVNQYLLKGNESRTIRTTVMIGKQYESKPAAFNGLFISFDEFRSWVQSGKTGVKYWVVLEGYDYKLNDNYNVFMPIEINFNTQLANTSTGTGTGTSTGTNTGTNPYSPF